MKLIRTNDSLQAYVEAVSEEWFHHPFRHRATFNSRLRTTGGRYHLQTHHLDFNPKILDVFGEAVFLGIVKHELCHYHLHIAGRGYQHRDADFHKLLKKVGGLRYTPSLEQKSGVAKRWHYQCSHCGQSYYRKRRVNTSSYCCGRCHGKLKLFEQVICER